MSTTETTTTKPRAKRAAAKKNDIERILLPANMEMNGLGESFGLLRAKYPPSYSKVVLDGANISVIDASGIQLLVNFVRSVKQQGAQVEWDNYPLPAYMLANEMGLVEQLGD